MRSRYILLLITLALLVVCSSAGKVGVFAGGTGIGIRVDGPSQAQLNQRISYNITVINLGDYWDRNLTVTDKFPNGTSSSWSIPDLAPLSQPGYQYTISGLFYVIRSSDVLSYPSPNHIDNNATVTGFAYVSFLNVTLHGVSNTTLCDAVQSETNIPTIIGILLVGGYSVSPELESLPTLSVTYVTLLSATIVAFGLVRFKFKQTK